VVADADVAAVVGDDPPSSRVPLSTAIVVMAAVDHIEERGLPELTMRRLGQVLGVEAMSLYRHVSGREELLDAVVDHIVGEMDDDDDVVTGPTDGWQDFLQRLAHGVRRVALAHPRCFPLIASRPPEAPWLRPPLRCVRWVELFLQGLLADGFSDEAAVEAYRAFTSFLLGHLLLEVAAHGADVGLLDVLEAGSAPEGPDGGGLAGFPAVSRLRHLLTEDHAVAEFEVALETLLDRLAGLRSG